jgi:hypothetical protein
MDKIEKIKIWIFTAIIMPLVMPSCVRNDMDDCPATAVYSLTYEYILNPEETDKFVNLDKLFIYVFEKTTGECILMTTETGPFPSDYSYSLHLYPGEYDIITWGYDWPDNDPSQKATTVIPDIVAGVWGVPGTGTKIEEARLILEALGTSGKDGVVNTFNKRMEDTFYGEVHTVIEDLFHSKTDMLPLINLTNQVRIIFEDITTAERQNQVTVKITDKNGAYYFYKSASNNPVYDASYDKIEYRPYAVYRTDSILNKDPIVTGNIRGAGLDSVLVVDFSLLRLFKNEDPFNTSFSDARLVIEWTDGDGKRYGEGGDAAGLVFSLTDLLGSGLQKMGLPYNQESLDKLNRWEIRLNLQDAYMTGTVNVLGWEVEAKNESAGLL